MTEFVRARSCEQKNLRMEEIKQATDTLFSTLPYQEITLTMIANQLSWTRANLYKYVTTKEDIFLELCADKMNAYYDGLKAAFPVGCCYSAEVFAEVWAGILNAHKDYLHYSDILSTIVETNVSVDRLVEFKKNYYEKSGETSRLFHQNLGISEQDAYEIFLSVHYHAVGIHSICLKNPLVEQALKQAQLPAPEIDFRENLKKFILIQLRYYCCQSF